MACRLFEAEYRGRDRLVVDQTTLVAAVLQGQRPCRQPAQRRAKPAFQFGRVGGIEAVSEIDGIHFFRLRRD